MAAADLNERELELLHTEVRHILATPEFARSPVMAKLLKFLVGRRIENPQHPPKAYEVAVDALDRDPDFDVQSDSYPRVQVGRLRKMLENHYAERDVKPVIVIPKGNYGLQIHAPPEMARTDTPPVVGEPASPVSPTSPAAPRPSSAAGPLLRRPRRVVLPLAIVAVALLTTVLFLSARDDGRATSRIAHLPPKLYLAQVDASALPEQAATAGRISNFLENGLGRFATIRLSSEHATTAIPDGEPDAYRLDGRLVRLGEGWGVLLQLVALERDELIWQEHFNLTGGDVVADRMTPVIAQIADAFGEIAADQRAYAGNAPPLGYRCRLEFDEFRMLRDTSLEDDVRACIARSLEEDPDDPLILDAAAYLAHWRGPHGERTPDNEKGMQYASRAMLRGSGTAIANFTAARSAFMTGDCDMGRQFARRAVRLNPYDADRLGGMAAYFYECGDESGIWFAERAVRAAPSRFAVPYAILAFMRFADGDATGALEAARRLPSIDARLRPPYRDLVLAMAYAANAEIPRARRHWTRVDGQLNPEGRLSEREVLARLMVNRDRVDETYRRLRAMGLFAQQSAKAG